MREKDYPIDDLFIRRWSPRAMNGDLLTDEELFTLFESARWAPSSYNSQPWFFYYTKNGTKNWDLFFNLLMDSNKLWCKNSSHLILVLSNKYFEHNNKFSKTHCFSTGMACENLALQATLMNIVCHFMAGFDYNKAREKLNIDDRYEIICMIALGKPGPADILPKELQKREYPSDRKKIKEFIKEF